MITKRDMRNTRLWWRPFWKMAVTASASLNFHCYNSISYSAHAKASEKYWFVKMWAGGLALLCIYPIFWWPSERFLHILSAILFFSFWHLNIQNTAWQHCFSDSAHKKLFSKVCCQVSHKNARTFVILYKCKICAQSSPLQPLLACSRTTSDNTSPT